MVDIAVTKMSSKGQIVIPREIRKDFTVGEQFIIIRQRDQLILKRTRDLDENFKDDLLFAQKTEEALKRYESGAFKKTSGDAFFKMLEQW